MNGTEREETSNASQSAEPHLQADADLQVEANLQAEAHLQTESHLPECCRTKHRDDKEYRDLLNRLKRIEGQVRGLQGMVEDDRYCVEILTQVSAVQSALSSFSKVLLSSHIKSCVVQDVRNGREETVDELCATIQRLMK